MEDEGEAVSGGEVTVAAVMGFGGQQALQLQEQLPRVWLQSVGLREHLTHQGPEGSPGGEAGPVGAWVEVVQT